MAIDTLMKNLNANLTADNSVTACDAVIAFWEYNEEIPGGVLDCMTDRAEQIECKLADKGVDWRQVRTKRTVENR